MCVCVCVCDDKERSVKKERMKYAEQNPLSVF